MCVLINKTKFDDENLTFILEILNNYVEDPDYDTCMAQHQSQAPPKKGGPVSTEELPSDLTSRRTFKNPKFNHGVTNERPSQKKWPPRTSRFHERSRVLRCNRYLKNDPPKSLNCQPRNICPIHGYRKSV